MGIDIDASAFRKTDDDEEFHGETIIVAGAQTLEITAALTAAGERFMSVNELGDEYSEDDWDTADEMLYTPNYVSDVTAERAGMSIYVDCKGVIVPPMRRKFIAVLLEELERHGVSDARVFSSPNE